MSDMNKPKPFSQIEAELASAAEKHFRTQSYESCFTTLNKLLEQRKDDPCVLHNRAVAKYHLSNLTQTDDFRRTLQQILDQVSFI